MQLIYLTCVTILMFVTSLTLEVNPSQDVGTNQTKIKSNLKRSTEDNTKIWIQYDAVVRMSLLFFEAMRSGKLPVTKVSWRRDSMLEDRGFSGEDLSGGYYTNGWTYVKYAFQTAFTTTMLAWGVLLWPQGYRYDLLNKTGGVIKWATDYFIKCHPKEDSFYTQVSNETFENPLFLRPEDLNLDGLRTPYLANCTHPASDIVSEVAAALAAASIVFRDIFGNRKYSNKCLTHAKELYVFAMRCPGSHYSWMPDHYEIEEANSLLYYDDLTWAALWLYKATKDYSYLNDAETYYRLYVVHHYPRILFAYYAKVPGIHMLFSQLSTNPYYIHSVQEYINTVVYTYKRTKKGLIFFREDPLPLAANAAFLCLVAASSGMDDTRKCHTFAKKQIDYMLGLGSGRSYVVAYGSDPPTRIRHKPTMCSGFYACPGSQEVDFPNQHYLVGALVSGPDANDYFNDTRYSRDSSKYTKIRIDYNAGFTGAVAGLVQLYYDNDSTV